MNKPRVYLAGPISACNHDQRHAWRDDLKRGFSDEFEFIDPTDNIVHPDHSDYAVAQADVEAIQTCDAVLANMWRESIGTAFGVLHAHLTGKLVVAVDPNLIRSRMLAFYVDSVQKTIPAGLNSIRAFLRAEQMIVSVVKADGCAEPFDRKKLTMSVRKACLSAGQSDIVAARAIVAKTLEILTDAPADERSLPTSTIRDAVWDALAALGGDPLHEEDYDLIRRAWEAHEQGESLNGTASKTKQVLADEPLDIPIFSRGTHATLWGKQISGDAMRAFRQMARVEGLVEIVLGPFGPGPSPSKPYVKLVASKTQNLIDGVYYDNALHGSQQTFQIRCADPAKRDAILEALRTHLTNIGLIRRVVFSD